MRITVICVCGQCGSPTHGMAAAEPGQTVMQAALTQSSCLDEGEILSQCRQELLTNCNSQFQDLMNKISEIRKRKPLKNLRVDNFKFECAELNVSFVGQS